MDFSHLLLLIPILADMFALFSDSREGSWRHAATLLATVAGKPGSPRLNRSSATNFLSFSLKSKENSKVGIITKPAVAKGRWNEPCEIMEYTHLIYHELCRNPGLVSWSGVVGFVDCGVCWAPAREAGVAYYVLCDHLLLPSLHLSPMSLSFCFFRLSSIRLSRDHLSICLSKNFSSLR